MIQIKVEKTNRVQKITIKGHAMYDDIGKDIVCAGVSSVVITTVNGILKMDDTLISYKSQNGYVEINVLKENEIMYILLENMIDLLKEMKQTYKKNIKIEEVSL